MKIKHSLKMAGLLGLVVVTASSNAHAFCEKLYLARISELQNGKKLTEQEKDASPLPNLEIDELKNKFGYNYFNAVTGRLSIEEKIKSATLWTESEYLKVSSAITQAQREKVPSWLLVPLTAALNLNDPVKNYSRDSNVTKNIAKTVSRLDKDETLCLKFHEIHEFYTSEFLVNAVKREWGI